MTTNAHRKGDLSIENMVTYILLVSVQVLTDLLLIIMPLPRKTVVTLSPSQQAKLELG